MSSATPAAFLSAISMTTTSASCFSAMPRVTVAPTFPAPPTTVILRFIPLSPKRSAEAVALHVVDDRVGELRRLQFRGAIHQARKIVRYALGGNRPVHAFDNQVSRLVPAKVPQHHL